MWRSHVQDDKLQQVPMDPNFFQVATTSKGIRGLLAPILYAPAPCPGRSAVHLMCEWHSVEAVAEHTSSSEVALTRKHEDDVFILVEALHLHPIRCLPT